MPLATRPPSAIIPSICPEQQPDPANTSIALGPTYNAAGEVVSTTNLQSGAITDYDVNMFGEVYETVLPDASSSNKATAGPAKRL